MRRILPFVCLAVFIGLFALAAVLKWHCFCDGFSDVYCIKCGHWAYQCPRFLPRDEFGLRVVPCRPVSFLARHFWPINWDMTKKHILSPKRGPLFGAPSGHCPTCQVNNAASTSTFAAISLKEGGR